MHAFDAVITRDGTVYHVPWGVHLDIISHYGIPENTSMVRQNYWEYDLRVPFAGGYGGLQLRDVEEPPEAVMAAAERLTGKLGNWHRGNALETIPDAWGDMVEHVYGMMGDETPEFLNGRGAVYFRGVVDEVGEGTVKRLVGGATVRRLSGAAVIEAMWARSRVDEMQDESRIGIAYEGASVGRMTGRSVIDTICQSTVVEEMRDSSRVMLMHGASRVLALHGRALAARGCDGVVCTPDKKVRKRALVKEHERWKKVKVVEEGASVFA